MNAPATNRRGQPLFVLCSVLAVWIVLRMAIWESPILRDLQLPGLTSSLAQDDHRLPVLVTAGPDGPADASRSQAFIYLHAPKVAGTTFKHSSPANRLSYVEYSLDRPSFLPPTRLSTASSHQLMWMAAMAYLPVRSEAIPARNLPLSAAYPPSQAAPQKVMRWSFDGWVLWRPDAGSVTEVGPNPSVYGSSQAGASMRYRLAPDSGHNPNGYVRVTKALFGAREGDIAAGLAARIVPDIPLSAHAELRLSRVNGSTEIRPAAFAVTELPPQQLPLGIRAEAYGQAGYVGGRLATAFADGQVKLDKEIAAFDLGKIRAGIGAWGGAQRGAERVDVGPSASIEFKLAEANARLSVDYRYRVAGGAVPQSGIAVTLSTGF